MERCLILKIIDEKFDSDSANVYDQSVRVLIKKIQMEEKWTHIQIGISISAVTL